MNNIEDLKAKVLNYITYKNTTMVDIHTIDGGYVIDYDSLKSDREINTNIVKVGGKVNRVIIFYKGIEMHLCYGGMFYDLTYSIWVENVELMNGKMRRKEGVIFFS